MDFNRLIRLFISFSTLVIFSSVHATGNKATNLYINGELGWSSLASGHVTPYQFKHKKNFGYRLSGGYLFPINVSFSLGPEVGYGYYGKTSYENSIGLISNYKLSAWDVLANLKYKSTEWFNLYFKAGIANLSQQLVIVGPNATPGGFYQQATKPLLVFAGSYNLTKQTELLVSYTHIFANPAPLTSSQQFTFTNVNQICSVDAIMLGLVYNI